LGFNWWTKSKGIAEGVGMKTKKYKIGDICYIEYYDLRGYRIELGTIKKTYTRKFRVENTYGIEKDVFIIQLAKDRHIKKYLAQEIKDAYIKNLMEII
jgi:hypothetical protein